MVDEMEAATDRLIEKHRAQIEACAKALYEEETLTGDEFRSIWNAAAEANNSAEH
jgi:ATP-dependent Zn protease